MKKQKKKVSPFKKKQAYQRYQRFLGLGKRAALGVFIISFVWISVDGYHRLVSRQLVEEAAHLIKPLSPQVKTDILKEIESKQYFSVEQVDRYFETVRVSSELEEEVELEEGPESSPSGENEEREEDSEE